MIRLTVHARLHLMAGTPEGRATLQRFLARITPQLPDQTAARWFLARSVAQSDSWQAQFEAVGDACNALACQLLQTLLPVPASIGFGRSEWQQAQDARHLEVRAAIMRQLDAEVAA